MLRQVKRLYSEIAQLSVCLRILCTPTGTRKDLKNKYGTKTQAKLAKKSLKYYSSETELIKSGSKSSINCSLSKSDYKLRIIHCTTSGPSYLRYSSYIDDKFHFCFFRKQATTIPVLLLPSSLIIITGRFDVFNTRRSALTTN